MHDKKVKRPNAVKHGVYAQIAIFPGEDREKFDELHAELIAEWMPAGKSEEDAVLSIAKAVWRKRRAQKFLEIQLIKNLLNPKHPLTMNTLALAPLSPI